MRKLNKNKTTKIVDMSKEEQTDDVKIELLNLTRQFVRKYQPQLYKQYKGELEDLVMDFYSQFLTEKGRDENNKQSLLDKWDSSITTLPYLVKVAVQRMLIDRSRSDKGEKRYTTEYDENTGDLTLDFLAKLASNSQNKPPELSKDLEIKIRQMWKTLSKDKVKNIKAVYEEVKEDLPDDFQKLFEDLLSSNEFGDYTVKVDGKSPSYNITIIGADGKEHKEELRAANVASVMSKLNKMYPGADIIDPMGSQNMKFKITNEGNFNFKVVLEYFDGTSEEREVRARSEESAIKKIEEEFPGIERVTDSKQRKNVNLLSRTSRIKDAEQPEIEFWGREGLKREIDEFIFNTEPDSDSEEFLNKELFSPDGFQLGVITLDFINDDAFYTSPFDSDPVEITSTVELSASIFDFYNSIKTEEDNFIKSLS